MVKKKWPDIGIYTYYYPAWIDEKIKNFVLHKNCVYNAYSQDENNADLLKIILILLINFNLFIFI